MRERIRTLGTGGARPRRIAGPFLAIAKQTSLESVRSPALLLAGCGCVALHALLPMTVSHTLGESGRMMADASLALHLLTGLLLGGFSACRALSGEGRGGTASSILSKPVSPAVFFLAKYVGVAAALLAVSLIATASGLLGARAAAVDYTFDPWAALPLLAAPAAACALAGALDFFARRPFLSTAFFCLILCVFAAFVTGGLVDWDGRLMAFGSMYEWPLVHAHLLVAQAVLLLAALALALAVRLRTVSVLTCCAIVFFGGLMSDYLFGRAAQHHWAAALMYRLTPNWQLFWAMDALHEGRPLPAAYLAEVSLYALLLAIAFLGFGLALFRHTETES